MRQAKAALWAVLGVLVVLGLVAGGISLWATYNKAPLPIDDRCTATTDDHTTTIDPAQARNAAIIAGGSIKRRLAPRAASIALATAYQESGIRNLDYGHADSLGLFQQRPSKGWGTEEQIMDPWYSTRSFYREMEKVKGWKTKDINDVAQAVQRSAYPEAYRRHVPNARTLASSLTGETPASFTCLVAKPKDANPQAMRDTLIKTLGTAAIKVQTSDDGLLVTAQDSATAWAVAHQAIANTADFGLSEVVIGPYGWTRSTTGLSGWVGSGPTDTTSKVKLKFTDSSPR